MPRDRPGGGQLAAAVAMPWADVLALGVATAWAALSAGGHGGWLIAGYSCAVFIALSVAGLHRLRICLRVSDQLGRIIAAAAVPVIPLLLWIPDEEVLRLAAGTAALLIGGRAATSSALRAAHRRGRLTESAVLVGAGPPGQQLASLLLAHPELGLRPRGFVDSACLDSASADRAARDGAARDGAARDGAARDRGAVDGASADGAAVDGASDRGAGPGRNAVAGARPGGNGALPLLGAPADLADVVLRHGISRVIVCVPAGPGEDLVSAVRAVRGQADVCLLPHLPDLAAAVPTACLDEVWGVPLIPLRHPGQPAWARAAKRAFDVAVAAVLLAVAAPVLAVAALAVRLRLRRPALFRQVRVVGSGHLAEIVKLRTLGQHSDPDTCWTVPAARCGALGRFLRLTHIDELPQLISVLRGDLSLVGPRPERPHFVRQFSQAIPGYAGRQRMPAGMTGWAQVHGLNGDTSITDRARFDNFYIEYWSFWLDLVILARTVTSIAAEAAGPAARARRRAAAAGPAAEWPAAERPAARPPSRPSMSSASQGG